MCYIVLPNRFWAIMFSLRFLSGYSYHMKIKNKIIITQYGYGQRVAVNALKRSLIGQFVKFFLLIDPSNTRSGY